MRSDRSLALLLKLSQNINTKIAQREIRELFESVTSELNVGFAGDKIRCTSGGQAPNCQELLKQVR